jgi:hypothetical protein
MLLSSFGGVFPLPFGIGFSGKIPATPSSLASALAGLQNKFP